MQEMGNRPTTTRERFTSGERHMGRREEEEEEDTEGKLNVSLVRGEGDRWREDRL